MAKFKQNNIELRDGQKLILDTAKAKYLTFDGADTTINTDLKVTSVSGIIYGDGSNLTGAGETDHGALDGLSDDDHDKYPLITNFESDRATIATNWSDLTDGGEITLHSHAAEGGTYVAGKYTTVTNTTSGTVNLTTSNFGNTYVFTGTDGPITYNLPTVSGTDLGGWFRFVKTVSSGTVTIQAGSTDYILDSPMGGMLTASGTETYANIGLQLATADLWIDIGTSGDWGTAAGEEGGGPSAVAQSGSAAFFDETSIGAKTFNFNYTAQAGSNRAVVIHVNTEQSGGPETVSNVTATLGGNAMTLAVDGKAQDPQGYVFYILEADIKEGSQSFVFSCDMTGAATCGQHASYASTFTGVNQSSPYGDTVLDVITYDDSPPQSEDALIDVVEDGYLVMSCIIPQDNNDYGAYSAGVTQDEDDSYQGGAYYTIIYGTHAVTSTESDRTVTVSAATPTWYAGANYGIALNPAS